MSNQVDFSAQIADFRAADEGEEVRDSLIDIAEAVQGAVNGIDDALTGAIGEQLLTVDASLTTSGAGADAKETGRRIANITNAITPIVRVHVDIDFSEPGHDIITGGMNAGVTIDLTPHAHTGWRYAIIPCANGDRFFVHASGASAARAWAWVTEENALISNSSSGAVDTTITAPATAAKLILNDSTGSGYAYQLVGADQFYDLQARFNKLEKYVAVTGNDDNDGNSSTNPYATIGKALSTGAQIIHIAHGSYTETAIPENTDYRYNSVKIIADNATLTMQSHLHFRLANVYISGLNIIIAEAQSDQRNGFFLLKCTGCLMDCSVSGAPYMGFRMDDSKLVLNRCTAYNCGVDGFNAHTIDYDPEISLIDCKAYNNGDDGASVHENGKLYVRGGEYYGNTQTGLAPHDNCYFQAINVYCHDNGKGIEALKDSSGNGKGSVIGCILADNTTYGLDVKNYTVSTLGNGYDGNGSENIHAGTGATIKAYTAT